MKYEADVAVPHSDLPELFRKRQGWTLRELLPVPVKNAAPLVTLVWETEYRIPWRDIANSKYEVRSWPPSPLS